MFVKKTTVRSGGKTYRYLSLVKSYRDEEGTSRQKTLFRLGRIAELVETGQLDRIVAALSAHAEGTYVEAGELKAQQAPAVGPIAAIAAFWDKLELGEFFEQLGGRLADGRGLSWSLADAVFAMVANRLCEPASKRKTARWIARDVVAPEGFSFPDLQHYYRALDHLCAAKDELEVHLYRELCDLANLDLTLVCFRLTSTYFEGSTEPSGAFPSRAFGYSRDGRSDRPQAESLRGADRGSPGIPQVVVGLLTTRDGIPIAHHVFAGNTADVATLPGILADLQEAFAVGRVCVVADRLSDDGFARRTARPRGLMSADNLQAIEEAGCDWVVATRLHRDKDVAAALEAAAAADEEAWSEVGEFDSRVCEATVDDARYVVVFSDAREQRDTARMAQLIATTEARLLKLEARVRRGDLDDKAEIAAAAERAVAGPVRRLFDISDIAEGRFVYDYDHAALAYDERLAGHYLIATSLEAGRADAAEVLRCYRSLEQVEARFRCLKDFLALRPVYHGRDPSRRPPRAVRDPAGPGSRVRGHIAVCVLAAVIESLIGQALQWADVADPDLADQTLTARRALEELDRVRQVTLDADGATIEAVTTRSPLQARILAACGVDTAAWQKPVIHT